jgi:hypothetical protein
MRLIVGGREGAEAPLIGWPTMQFAPVRHVP